MMVQLAKSNVRQANETWDGCRDVAWSSGYVPLGTGDVDIAEKLGFGFDRLYDRRSDEDADGQVKFVRWLGDDGHTHMLIFDVGMAWLMNDQGDNFARV